MLNSIETIQNKHIQYLKQELKNTKVELARYKEAMQAVIEIPGLWIEPDTALTWGAKTWKYEQELTHECVLNEGTFVVSISSYLVDNCVNVIDCLIQAKKKFDLLLINSPDNHDEY